MTATVESILSQLEAVSRERAARAGSPELARRVDAIKAYQQRRFSKTYADLLESPRYAAAARFFLEELYGPGDFSQRDQQFARVVPALVRLFPSAVVDTVETLARLHALSESLDSDMGSHLPHEAVDAPAYISAWRTAARKSDREQQIALMLSVGHSLNALTRKPLLRQALRAMRGPARAAGLAALQQFLENGFDTFQAMRGAEEFMGMVAARERALAAALFDDANSMNSVSGEALGQLP